MKNHCVVFCGKERDRRKKLYLTGKLNCFSSPHRSLSFFVSLSSTQISVHIVPIHTTTTTGRRYIEFECTRYLYDDRAGSFEVYESQHHLIGTTKADLFKNVGEGLKSVEAVARRENVGGNEVAFTGDSFWSGLVKE